MAEKTTVALLFGGRSSEHSVSCATAAGVLAAIDRDRYEVLPIGITRDGAFVLADDDSGAYALRDGRLAEVADNGTRIVWPERAGTRRLAFTGPNGRRRAETRVDVVFPLLHGRWGEDGTVQGLLELFGLPYVGAGVLASAAAMDKAATKTLVAGRGIPVAPDATIEARRWRRDPARARREAERLGFPVFVKPSRAGSSVGVSRVESPDGLDAALEAAFAEDDRALVETFVDGREIEVAVLAGRAGARARAAVPGEIAVVGDAFYDFEAKYRDAPGVELRCPAPLTAEERERVQGLAVEAFEALGAEGLARVDFFLTREGFVLNEVNTMPGFTPISMFPKCWEASGLGYTALLTELVEAALER